MGGSDAWTCISSVYEVESLARVCHASLDRSRGHHTIACCCRCGGSRASGGNSVVILNAVAISCDMCAGGSQGRVLNILSEQNSHCHVHEGDRLWSYINPVLGQRDNCAGEHGLASGGSGRNHPP